MTHKIGEAAYRYLVKVREDQGREIFTLVDADDAEDATGELVHYFEGEDESVEKDKTFPTAKYRVMYEPRDGEARRVDKASN